MIVLNIKRNIYIAFLNFSHLVIRWLIKGLSPILATFITFSIEMGYNILYDDSKLWEEYLKNIF